ncbi:MAG: DUF4350 domain-containing protein [Myxococcota bacterium]
MSRRMQILLLISLSSILVTVIGTLVWAFEPVEEEVARAARGEAATNEYYAAEQMLTAMGVPARSVWDLVEPPPKDTLLILIDDNTAARDQIDEVVVRWVRSGGRLLIAAPSEAEIAPILNLLGAARVTPTDVDFIAEDSGFTEVEPTEREEITLSQMPLAGGAGIALLERPPWRVTHVDATHRWSMTASTGEVEDVAIVFPYGGGQVAVIGGAHLWVNHHIGESEHATLLWELVAAIRGDTKKALLVVRGGASSIWALLWRYARPAVVSLATLILIGLWRSSRRFGPMLPERGRERRSMVEHVEAAGGFLWRQADGVGRARLIQSARRAAKRPPEDVDMPPPETQRAFLDEVRALQPDWRKQ